MCHKPGALCKENRTCSDVGRGGLTSFIVVALSDAEVRLVVVMQRKLVSVAASESSTRG